MGLYDRLLGRDDAGNPLNVDAGVGGKIPVHAFSAVMGEFARGRITGAQAQSIITEVSGSPLTASEVTEAQTLLGTINGAGTAKLARAKEIDDVLMLGESNTALYNTPTEIKARLGV